MSARPSVVLQDFAFDLEASPRSGAAIGEEAQQMARTLLWRFGWVVGLVGRWREGLFSATDRRLARKEVDRFWELLEEADALGVGRWLSKVQRDEIEALCKELAAMQKELADA